MPPVGDRDTTEGNPGSSTPLPILHARQHEYSRACREWFADAVHNVARAIDPLYEQIQWRQYEAISETVATFSESDSMILPTQTIEAESSLSVRAIIECDLSAIRENVIDIAEQLARQTVKNFLETISAITEHAGNVVDASSGGLDGVIAALEALDIEFDESGNPTTQILLSPETYARLKEEERTASPEKLQQIASLIAKKRREYFASRRHRRLPRLGY